MQTREDKNRDKYGWDKSCKKYQNKIFLFNMY